MQSSGERFNNKGAYIVLGPPNFDDPVFHTFKAVTLGAKVWNMKSIYHCFSVSGSNENQKKGKENSNFKK